MGFTLFLSIMLGHAQGDKSPRAESLQILGPLANAQAVLKDPLIPELVQHIRTKYGAHTLILYGSRARGTKSPKKEYEIMALQRGGEIKRDQVFLKNASLAIAIFPDNYGDIASCNFPLLWQDAIVLEQPHREGEHFVKALKKAYDDDQKALTQTKKHFIRTLTVNLGRGQKNEIRDHFYRRKFLTFALARYGYIVNIDYMDPGQILAWLQKNDPLTYTAFNKALKPQASNEDLYDLLVRIAGPDLEAEAASQVKLQTQKASGNKKKREEKYVSSKDPLLPDIVRHIKKTYGAHTIILYGSRAQGTANPKSDYDLFVIRRSRTEKERVKGLFKGASLDLHLFSEEILNDRYLTPSLAIAEGAVILIQKDKMGTQIVQRIKDIYSRGFFPSNKIKNAIIGEIKGKQLKIAGTPEGYFYQNSLLVSLLEHYFTLRNLYFIGTREAFRWLKKNDLVFYYAFEKALKPDASIESLNELVEIVIEGVIFDEKAGNTVVSYHSS